MTVLQICYLPHLRWILLIVERADDIQPLPFGYYSLRATGPPEDVPSTFVRLHFPDTDAQMVWVFVYLVV